MLENESEVLMSIRYTRSVVGAAVFTCAFAGWAASKALAQTDDHGKMAVTAAARNEPVVAPAAPEPIAAEPLPQAPQPPVEPAPPAAAPSLPKTASPLPAVGLLGLWSLGTAMGLSLFDRMRPGPS
jgi:hypothetical protein